VFCGCASTAPPSTSETSTPSLALRCADYDTGGAAGYTKAAVESGQALQLTLYAMAAEHLLLKNNEAVPWQFGYWFVADNGFKKTLLLHEDGHCLRDQALDIRSSSDVDEEQDFRATSLETLRQMVASGVGITLLPELAGRGAYGAARGVTIKPFARPVPSRTIGAVWRKSTARRAAIAALCKQIEAHAL
jgi:hypothetical protein